MAEAAAGANNANAPTRAAVVNFMFILFAFSSPIVRTYFMAYCYSRQANVI
jgi:hypothetical protein